MLTLIKRPYAALRRRLKKGVLAKLDQKALPYMEKKVKKHSMVGDHTFFNSKDFPWIAEIENNWQDIRKELDQVMQTTHIPSFQEVSKEQKQLTQDDKWKTFIFYFYGHEREENCLRCPRTIELLHKIPGMKTAFFSILSPQKHIPPHRGPYNGVLRFHLGLRIPKNPQDCKIRVGDDIGYWQQGKSLVFDDSYQHEVWNDTDEIRVVLFVDFLRPLPKAIDFLNKLYIKHIAASRFIQDAVGNLDEMAGRKKKKIAKVPA